MSYQNISCQYLEEKISLTTTSGLVLVEEMKQEFLLFQSAGEKCPYVPGRVWVTHVFQTNRIAPAFYESLISQGFRRSGTLFYQNHCPECKACLPIRVDVRDFRPSRSQRRVLKKNRDVRFTLAPAVFDDTGFQLYRSYCEQRHPTSPAPNREDYRRFLIVSPVPTKMMRYYLHDQLIGIGWIDVLPHSLSSVYFSFDVDYSSRSLGIFSILRQIELCRALGKSWLQLGFWVETCQKMSYKNRFTPCHVLRDGKWQYLPNR
jgi:arginine-tRNA-protein transferase